MIVAVPRKLAAWHQHFFGDRGRAWIAALPGLAAELLDRWQLTLDGPSSSGAVALVLPVRRADGTAAVLKLQPVDQETIGEPIALRAWAGDGAVRLLDHDPASGSMLLERLDPERTLMEVEDDEAALSILVGLLARLDAVPAPAGLRTLADVATDLLARVPAALDLVDAADRRLIERCADPLPELLAEPGDRLLHWDLHFGNVLAGDREPWLAIDPKPLAGDPGFDLLPALHNRWSDVVATGDPDRAARRRFDLMTEALGLDRERARGWTLARILENLLWDAEHGATHPLSGPDRELARILTR